MLKLFIDDIREPPDSSYKVARSYKEAEDFLNSCRVLPSHISFDHDLGEDKSGYDIAKLIVNLYLDNIVTIPDGFTFKVHSMNPVGASNIQHLISNMLLINGKN